MSSLVAMQPASTFAEWHAATWKETPETTAG